jgi:hypothetical protein
VNTYDERRVTATLEGSLVIGWLARLGAAVAQASRRSSLLSLVRPLVDAIVRRPGLTLTAAALTHVLVMTAVSRPPSWQWLILPSLFVAMGAALWLMVDERSRG